MHACWGCAGPPLYLTLSFHLTVRVLTRIPEFSKLPIYLHVIEIFVQQTLNPKPFTIFFYPCQFILVTYFFMPDCEWKAQAGNACVASFDYPKPFTILFFTLVNLFWLHIFSCQIVNGKLRQELHV